MVSYCKKEDVKNRLKIEKDDAKSDTEINDCIEEAQEYIDNALKNHVTTPLSTVPTFIKHITADLAAGIFQRRRSQELLTGIRVYPKAWYTHFPEKGTGVFGKKGKEIRPRRLKSRVGARALFLKPLGIFRAKAKGQRGQLFIQTTYEIVKPKIKELAETLTIIVAESMLYNPIDI